MKKTLFWNLFVVMALFSMTAMAQTVQVPGTYATIQAAIDSFDADSTPEDNVIEITTEGPIAEGFTMDNPVTIRGAASSGNPTVITVQDNAGDGIVVNSGSAFNKLENLIILPDTTSPPTDDGVWITEASTELHLVDVLISPNNGSDLPVYVDPFTEPDLTGATQFVDETVLASGGGIFHATDLIICGPGSGTSPDLLGAFSSSGAGHTLNKGCIFAFGGRYCAQVNNSVAIRGTTEEPVIFTTSGVNNVNQVCLGFFGGGDYSVENAIIANSGGVGMLVYDTLGGDINVLPTIDHVAFVGNGGYGLQVNTGTVPLSISNCTFVDNGDVFLVTDEDVSVNALDTIFAGNGEATANSINNDASPAVMTLTNCAVVGVGSYSVASTTNVVEVNVIAADPAFTNVSNFSVANFLDVRNAAYDAKASGGGPLVGYGDYTVGQLTGLKDWADFR